MPLQQFKPTSPGRRFAVRVTTPELHKGEPFAGLVTKLENLTQRQLPAHLHSMDASTLQLQQRLEQARCEVGEPDPQQAGQAGAPLKKKLTL